MQAGGVVHVDQAGLPAAPAQALRELGHAICPVDESVFADSGFGVLNSVVVHRAPGPSPHFTARGLTDRLRKPGRADVVPTGIVWEGERGVLCRGAL